jgi:hypothetical protein
MWAGITEPPLPTSIDTTHVNKWGETFDTPSWEDLRTYIKYPSSRHLLPLYWHSETVVDDHIGRDDTGLQTLEDFVGRPLVITHKIDGGNCTLVSDVETPVRARNGSKPAETMRPLYRPGGLYWEQEVNQKLPDRLQVVGEWVWAKHSIHYGCDCETPCEDIGPALSELTGIDDERAYFHVFGVFDTTLNLWLSWPETEQVADTLGFPTVPVIHCEDEQDAATFETEHDARTTLLSYARDAIDNGGEGIVVRSKFPFHYGQFPTSLGKYVRANHVKTEDHWSHTEVIKNRL